MLNPDLAVATRAMARVEDAEVKGVEGMAMATEVVVKGYLLEAIQVAQEETGARVVVDSVAAR